MRNSTASKFQQGVVVCNVVGFVELFWTFVVRQVSLKAELFASFFLNINQLNIHSN